MLARLNQPLQLKILGPEKNAVTHHKLKILTACRTDHGKRVLPLEGDRFFTKHMFSLLESLKRNFAM